MTNKERVLVLYGGASNEREVSLRSGANVAEYLQKAGCSVALADVGSADFNLVALCRAADVVLPVVHGAGGEDGSLQQQLEAIGIPYFGSRPEACARTFNKVACKERLAENGILTPTWEVVDRAQFEASGLRKKSYVLKPIASGSSIDMCIVHNPGHQPEDTELFDKLFKRYKHMLLEELIEGREVTVGVLGEKALPLILIVPPPGQEFDYANKYNGHTQEIAKPHDLSASVQRAAQKLALQVHTLTGCRHLSRTDIIIAEDGALYVLETNTIPGMTAQSLFPNAAAAAGIDMTALVTGFVVMAKAL